MPKEVEMIMNEEAKIRDFILENFMAGESEEALDNDTSFLEKGIIDSMGVLELVAFVEETYGIEIDDDELTPDNFDSVSKLVSYIRRKSIE
jgi:acyl carrier protein